MGRRPTSKFYKWESRFTQWDISDHCVIDFSMNKKTPKGYSQTDGNHWKIFMVTLVRSNRKLQAVVQLVN